MPRPTDRAEAHARLVAAARTLARVAELGDRAAAPRADTPPPLPSEPTQTLRAAVAALLAAERAAGAAPEDGGALATRIVRSALWEGGAGTLSPQTVARVLIATRRAAAAADR